MKISDAPQINEIRRQREVVKNTLSMPIEYEEKTIKFIENLSENDYVLVALWEEKVIGIASLQVGKERKRHKGMMGISIHSNYHNQGIGTKLMERLLDIADNWLMLKRVELEVLEGNEIATHLYEKLGFVEEGTKKFATIQDGRYIDEIMMARYYREEK